MATKPFTSLGLRFVPNNFAALLENDRAPEAFHLIQNFLRDSEIGQALIEPAVLSASQIATFWQNSKYVAGGENGTPSIIFTYDEEEFVITPQTVRETMDFDTHTSYAVVSEQNLRDMLTEIGYMESLAKLGSVRWPNLRKEWNFFFDCITRTFQKKVTNWDAIPMDSLQIGYSLLYGSNFDFGRYVLMNLGDKLSESTTVYFARFCQLLFNACVSGLEIDAADVIQPFKVNKRIFSDMTNKDVGKDLHAFVLPLALQNFLNQPQDSQSPHNEQQQTQPEP